MNEPSTRQRILDAALEIFTQMGYHGSSTRKLASRAGITEGAIFRHFASKKEILLALLTPQIENGLKAALEEIPSGQIESVLQLFFQKRLQQFSQLFPILKIVLLESEVEPELKAGWVQGVLLQVQSQLSHLFQERQLSAEITSKYPPEALARIFMSQLFGSLFLNQVSEGAFFGSEGLKDTFTLSLDLFLEGILVHQQEDD